MFCAYISEITFLCSGGQSYDAYIFESGNSRYVQTKRFEDTNGSFDNLLAGTEYAITMFSVTENEVRSIENASIAQTTSKFKHNWLHEYICLVVLSNKLTIVLKSVIFCLKLILHFFKSKNVDILIIYILVYRENQGR